MSETGMTDQKRDAVDTQQRGTDHLGRACKGSQLQMQIAEAQRLAREWEEAHPR